jgi:hypothetical protein
MRRLGFAVLTTSMAVAACGRIVTLPKTNNAGGTAVPSGDMLIRFRTQGTLDFVNFRYVVIFNTSGNGQTPLATALTSFTNYSFALVFGGTSLAGASYSLFQIANSQTAAGFTTIQVLIPPQFVQNFNPNSDGQGNEFTFTFNRQLLLGTPNPFATTTPSPTPTATPTPGATPTPVPTPTPTPVPNATPTPAAGQSTLWAMNFFSTNTQGQPYDAIANTGVSDVSFTYVVDTTIFFDQPVNKPVPDLLDQVANPSGAIIAIEVVNSP